MSVTINSPTSGSTVMACPVSVSVSYDLTGKGGGPGGGPGLPTGWSVRVKITKGGVTHGPVNIPITSPVATVVATFFPANSIPNGTGYTIEADVIKPDGSVHSSATPQSPVEVKC
jgi:hypothetical protein